MKNIKTLLWDVDGTLLDFLAAEKYGMTKCCREIGVEMDEEMLAVYSGINRAWWEKHERGEVTQREVFTGRLRELFARYGIPDTDYDRFNEHYQIALGEAVFPLEDSLRLFEGLGRHFRQYVVTNGSREAQEAKLRRSGLDRMADGVFISSVVGAQKPTAAFFDFVREKTGYLPAETMIIGDSLTSDILGGNNAGIRCCWYNPKGAARREGIRVDHELHSLWELPTLLGVDLHEI